MKRLLTFLSVLCCISALQAQPLKFHNDGTFKIVQFTDLHFNHNTPASDVCTYRMNEVLDAERPDLVIVTGDVIYGAPADVAMRKALAPIIEHKIPFVVTFGNHDHEFGMGLDKLYDLIRTMPYNIQPDRGEAYSPDYILTVKSSKEDRDAAVLYCIDSHDYSNMRNISTYDWIKTEQIVWYKQQSQAFTQANKGQPMPALAFFHIALPEFNDAVEDQSSVLIGNRMEACCSPKLNSGMFTAIKECGDVMGVFVGHDHDNDYSVMWQDVLFAYGRFTGGNTEYNHLPNGARVILLEEGARRFQTWITEKGGKRVFPSVYPDSYVKDDWRQRPLVRE